MKLYVIAEYSGTVVQFPRIMTDSGKAYDAFDRRCTELGLVDVVTRTPFAEIRQKGNSSVGFFVYDWPSKTKG